MRKLILLLVGLVLLMVVAVPLFGTVTASRIGRIEKGARYETWGVDSMVGYPTTADTVMLGNVFKVGDYTGVVVEYRGTGSTTLGKWLLQYQRLGARRDTTWGKWIDIAEYSLKTDTVFNLSSIVFQPYIRFRFICTESANGWLYMWLRIHKWGR